MARTQYAFYPAFNTALVSLHNVENHLGARNRRTSNSPLEPVVITSPILDPFPVRQVAGDGTPTGDGFIEHQWDVVLAALGWQFLRNTYFSSGAVVSANWTIYTLTDDTVTYARYNAIAELPSRAAGTLAPLNRAQGEGVFRVRILFHDLIAI